MYELREKLLKLMVGTSAQQWMDRRDLLAKTGASEQQLDTMLLALHEERAINRAQVIRGDTVIHAIWITGVVAKVPRRQFTINPAKRPPSGSFTKPEPTEKKEKPMKSQEAEQKKSVMQRVLDIIILEPGVTPESIKRRFTQDEQSACNKAFYGLRKHGRIEREEENGKVRFHPTASAADHVGHAKRVVKSGAPAKLLTGEEARPFQQNGIVTGNEKHTVNDDASTANDMPTIPSFLLKSTQPPAPPAGANSIADHLAALAAAVPPGVIFSMFKSMDGSMELALDTKAGASFNVGNDIDAAVRCIDALAVIQPFAEH